MKRSLDGSWGRERLKAICHKPAVTYANPQPLPRAEMWSCALTSQPPHPTHGNRHFRTEDTWIVGHSDATSAGAVRNHLPWLFSDFLAAVPPMLYSTQV